MTRIYLAENVVEASRTRIAWLLAEFKNLYVCISGGKDSTVILNIALEEAAKMGLLPVNVMFIDQEAEWGTVISHMREVMHDPRVRAHWLQVPIRLFNATSAETPWLDCWNPAKEALWMRPREPDSVHENVFRTDRFAKMFDNFLKHQHPTEKACIVGGVRAEESPARSLGLTSYETYKGETWGKFVDKKAGHFIFYPIYDWAYTDVWKAIHENGWPYSRIYDLQYQYGVPLRQMRVSNLHHETAVRSLFILQELEPETWERLIARLGGINTAGHLQENFYRPKTLPPMFKDWREYRDHLLENLITNPEHLAYYRRVFPAFESRYSGKALQDLIHTQIAMILVGDVDDVKLATFRASHMFDSKNRGKVSGRT